MKKAPRHQECREDQEHRHRARDHEFLLSHAGRHTSDVWEESCAASSCQLHTNRHQSQAKLGTKNCSRETCTLMRGLNLNQRPLGYEPNEVTVCMTRQGE